MPGKNAMLSSELEVLQAILTELQTIAAILEAKLGSK